MVRLIVERLMYINRVLYVLDRPPTQYVLDRLPNGVHEQGTRMAFFFTAVPRAEYEYSRVLYCTIACPSGFRHGLIYPYISCVTLPNAAHQHRRPTRAPQKRLTSSPRVQHVQRVGTLGTRVVRDTRVRTRHDLRRTHEIASQRPKIAAHETASRQTIALPALENRYVSLLHSWFRDPDPWQASASFLLPPFSERPHPMDLQSDKTGAELSSERLMRSRSGFFSRTAAHRRRATVQERCREPSDRSAERGSRTCTGNRFRP